MRLFIAIELPELVRNQLVKTLDAAWNPAACGDFEISRVPAENLHVTVKFLGEVNDADVPATCSALEKVPKLGDLLLWAQGFQCFPPRGPVRVVAVGLGGDEEKIYQLHHSIECALEPLGYQRERRRYQPHITLMRGRTPLPAAARAGFQKFAGLRFPGPQFIATEFVVMQSELNRAGSIYTPIARFALSDSP